MEIGLNGSSKLTGANPRSRSTSLWRPGLVIAALALASPIIVILASLGLPFSEVWQHLFETVLGDYVSNSLKLMLGVGAGTLVLGVSTAWLTAMCEFPGRRFFTWALLLPMAMPTNS